MKESSKFEVSRFKPTPHVADEVTRLRKKRSQPLEAAPFTLKTAVGSADGGAETRAPDAGKILTVQVHGTSDPSS